MRAVESTVSVPVAEDRPTVLKLVGYKIVSSWNGDHVNDQVNAMIADGWVPKDALSVVTGNYGTRYTQVMIRVAHV